MVQSAGAVEYTDCILQRGRTLLPTSALDMTKQSDGEVPIMPELWGV